MPSHLRGSEVSASLPPRADPAAIAAYQDYVDHVLDHTNTITGTRFVDEEGRVLATFPRAEGEDGPTAEVEILRGRFAGILVDGIRGYAPPR